MPAVAPQSSLSTSPSVSAAATIAPPQQAGVPAAAPSPTEARHTNRCAAGTAIASVTNEQPTGPACTPGTTIDTGDAGTAVAPIPEPPGRTTVTTVEAIPAAAEQPAVAAITRLATGASLRGPGIPVPDQDSAVRMLSGAIGKQEIPEGSQTGTRRRRPTARPVTAHSPQQRPPQRSRNI